MTEGARTRSLLGPAGIAVGYFVLAVASLLWTRGGGQIATMWPAGGLAVAALASTDRSQLRAAVAAVALGSMAANLVCGTPFWAGALYSTANVVESVVAVLLLRRCPFGHPSFVDVRQVACFCAIAALACIASTVVASAGTAWLDWRFSLSWFATDLLGIVLTAPLVILAMRRGGRPVAPGTTFRSFAWAMAGTALVAGVTFAQAALPILFLPFAALIAATYVAGPLAAAAGTSIIAVIGSVAIGFGYGPTALIHRGPDVQGFFLQFYLVALMGCSFSMAALLATRDRLVEQLRESNRLLFMAERVARIGHWHLDLGTQAVTWSDEVFRLYGLPEGGEPSLDAAIAAYHEGDRDRLTSAMAEATRSGGEFRLRARIVRPDGEVRHADVSGETIAVDGVVRSLFGVMQDVTDQVVIECGLEASRREALSLASKATILAETDALTGLANRRRVLEAIDEAVWEAATAGALLSVAMFDVDHFKRVNDLHGHAVGDAVLQRVATSAEAAVRASDLVGRLGGEEFIALLPGADRATAMQIADRIRYEVEAAGGGAPSVTVSVGEAMVCDGEDGAELIRRADRALYEAKAEGRNASRIAA